ncbi:MAG: outer membrane beta-barrel protein [Endomicrobiaceae bacterium]|nr:outer membrane beta-barrel protein [Endomicrobiaceae bacterium]MDD3922969.1 outer membrane beta-barrel protein [Endomicrobiaceae bacterium]
MKKTIIFLSLVLVSSVSSLFAEKPLSFLFLENLSYDDNIYYASKDKKSSEISSSQLFAKYFSNIPNTSLDLFAKVNVGYNAYTQDTAKNNFLNTGLDVVLENNKFTLKESFIYTSDPASSDLTERAQRMSNVALFEFRTSLEKMFSVGFVMSDLYDKYVEEKFEYLDRNRLNSGVQLFYNLSPKTSFFVEYLFSNINYQTNANSDSLGNSFIAGVNGQIASKVKGTAQVSYDQRNYDKEVNGAKKDADLCGYLVSLAYTPTTQNAITLSGERKMQETLYGANRYYVSTSVALELKQKIYQKWEASLLLAYEKMSYPISFNNVDRNDDLYRVIPSVEYNFTETLSAGVWYQFKDRQSNVDGEEYNNNKVGANIKLHF